MAPEGSDPTAARAVLHLPVGDLASTQGRADLAPGLPTHIFICPGPCRASHKVALPFLLTARKTGPPSGWCPS